MNESPTAGTGATGWHASPALLSAYAGGRAAEADAWSVEAHLIACSSCRAELAAALRPTDVRLLAETRRDLLAHPPATSPAVRRLFRLRWVLPPGTVVAVVLAVAGVTLFDVVTAVSDLATGSLLWLLAPAIPVAGVAVAGVRENDPCWEAVLAAPSAALRLALWRTLAVLVCAVPLAALAGVARTVAGGDPGWNAAWLLPCAALTAATLAAGSLVGVERAARVAVLLWCAATLGSPLARTGGDVVASLRLASTPLTETPAFAAAAQPLWAAATVAAVLALILNRERYQLVNPMNWSR
jgi:hypothetical protein